GSWDGGQGLLHLRIWSEAGHAAVQVANPVRAGSQTVRDLLDTIQWLKGFRTPEDAYRARLLEVAQAARHPGGGSRPGLARLAYEGRCALSAVAEGDVVTVTSTMEL